MEDLTIHLQHRPGALAAMAEALGDAGLNIDGGGVFVIDGQTVGHFLFADGLAARAVLERAGFEVSARRTVLLQRLDQDKPGQLGALTRLMADGGVNIEVMYSDHDHRLVLLVDDHDTGAAISQAWTTNQR